MARTTLNRWLGMGLGALVVAGATLALSHQTAAQQADASDRDTATLGQLAFRPQVGGGGQAQPGRRPFGGNEQPMGPGPGMMPMPFGGGGAQLTATATTVYVLRGNTLLAFDARTLKPVAQAELPPPTMMRGPGPMPPPGQGGE